MPATAGSSLVRSRRLPLANARGRSRPKRSIPTTQSGPKLDQRMLVGARYSDVSADQARCAAILVPRVSHSLPLPRGAGRSGRALGPFQGSRDHRVGPPTDGAPPASPPTQPAPGLPKQPATCTCARTNDSPMPEHSSVTVAANPSTPSTRSSEPRASRFSRPRSGHPWPTPSPSAGSAPCDASSSTAPSSGTNASSSGS